MTSLPREEREVVEGQVDRQKAKVELVGCTDPQQDPRGLVSPEVTLQAGLEGGLEGPAEALDAAIRLQVVGTGEVAFSLQEQSE